ncbi:MAG: cytochrome bc complex cytochrome b subunit [Proteobacteria bacterium]|nr:cytochrome bc complex cytochrome b subunit [Pseudomonadota bacterium]
MSGAAGWLDRRTGWRDFFRRHFTEARLPVGSDSWLSLGWVLVFAFALQIATGMLLLLYFVPAPEQAFESVGRIMSEVPYGWFVRLIHSHAANWMVLGLFVHLFHTALSGSYKAPRELTWITGCLLLLMVLGMALSGYILPWSQLSYWATTVVTASFRYVPFVGQELVEWVRGGELVGAPTFRRAFMAHVALLPAGLALVLVFHLALARRAGPAPPPVRGRTSSGTAPGAGIPFHPRFVLKHGIQIVLFLMLVFATVFFAPHLFSPLESFLAADPFDTPPNVKPEWYLLWAYQLPRMVPERLSLVLQGVAVTGLFALPFLDRGPARHPLDRPAATAAVLLALVALVVLTVLGYLA